MISLTNLLKREGNLELLANSPDGLGDILTELQGLSIDVAAGANADTNIAVSGITTDDTLVAVLEFTVNAGAFDDIVDQTADCSITSAGNIQCTNSTATSKLIIVWYNKA